ncbi:hypothetical protein DND132_2296 [Pseudodesulfovibrio mercurii]|uniref:Uncharacterized protein n=1 Tax=Pseudodesulfovibrio mercurii TaxID=641491 RepID=F0JIR6_9BACT|nr:hypothetical protein [Pseudodesulfovibrio mercurii]EGB15500.1 hypothetical protein DND132_2296 [Pseudodesulfovibrio mercurii]
MSMENDTRLAMMHMRNDAHRNDDTRPRRNSRTHSRVRPAASALAAFTLLLFTRGF